jgi:uncharacterized membrane protein YbaN (DUF454 family)
MRQQQNGRAQNSIVLLGRRILGIICIIIWIIGAILPIIPGWPALILAIVLLGRRDPMLRWMHLVARRSLRWLRLHPNRPIRRTGRWLSTQYVSARRAISPAIAAAEGYGRAVPPRRAGG